MGRAQRKHYENMVDPCDGISNHVFEVLREWETILSSCDLYDNPEELPLQEDDALPRKAAADADCGAASSPADGSGSCLD